MVPNILFPKKGQEKDKVEAELKALINQLELKSRIRQKKSDVMKANAKKYLKSGNMGSARIFIGRKMKLEKQAQRFQNIIGILERHLEALDTADTIKDLGNALTMSSRLLQKISANITPEKAAAISESAEESLAKIEEAGDLLGGELDTEFGLDVEEELNKLEADILLEEAGGVPTTPTSEGPEVSEEGEKEEKVKDKIENKEKIKKELEKLKKELDS